jgi:HTH-type transcriptional regulator/antitoxin HigA
MIKPIRDEQSYQAALARTAELWAAEIDTPDGDELDVLLTLVEVYESKHYPMPSSDPVEAIKFCMDQMNLGPKDLQQYLGPKSRVSDVLNRKRKLSIRQIVKLHKGMNIPYESLINENMTA